MDIEKLIADAVSRKASGKYNCAQAVACAFASEIATDEEIMKRMANSFGTGMGCLEATCGALIGAGLVLGMDSPDRVTAMKRAAAVVRKFKERNGATVCGDLKGVAYQPPRPLRACNLCVADAAEFLADELAKD